METTYKYKFSNKIKEHFKSKWWIYIVFLMLFLPILLYIINFRDQEISDNTSDWGDFGSYIGGWYSLITAIAAIIVTIVISRRNNVESKIEHCINKIVECYARLDTLYRDAKYYAQVSNSFIPTEAMPSIPVLNLSGSYYKQSIEAEFVTMDYYLKILPLQSEKLNKLRNSIHDTFVEPTNDGRWKYFKDSYTEFIQSFWS